jgi:hypothetical protein
MLPTTFTGIHIDEQGREYVTHKPSGTRYYVERKANHWSAHAAPNGKQHKRKHKKHKHAKQHPLDIGNWPKPPLPVLPRPVATARIRSRPSSSTA